jgi:hypothetical protein
VFIQLLSRDGSCRHIVRVVTVSYAIAMALVALKMCDTWTVSLTESRRRSGVMVWIVRVNES